MSNETGETSDEAQESQAAAARPEVIKTESPRTRTIMAVVRLTALVGLIIGLLVLFRNTPLRQLLDQEFMQGIIDPLGIWAYPLFVLFYTVLLALWIPGTPISALGVAAFGTKAALVMNYAGAVLGAALGFLIARLIGGRALEDLLAPRFPLYKRYERLLETRGIMTIFYMRLLPTPYTLVSWLGGLSRVSLGRFTVGTALGILPGSIVITYVMEAAVGIGRGEDVATLWSAKTLTVVGIYVVLAVLPTVIAWGRSRYGWFSRLDERS